MTDELSPLEETKQILEQIQKEKSELKIENDRREKLQSDILMAGTTGKGIIPKTQEEIFNEKVKIESDSIVNAFRRK